MSELVLAALITAVGAMLVALITAAIALVTLLEKRRWEVEDRKIAHETHDAVILAVNRADAAYKEANHINLKIANLTRHPEQVEDEKAKE